MDAFYGKNNDTRSVRRVENDYSQPEDIYENPLSIRTARGVNRLEEAANVNQENVYIDGSSAIISKGFRFKKEYFILIFHLIVVVGLSVTVAVLYNKNEFMGTKIDKIELELDDLKYHLKDIDNNHTIEVNLTRMELLSLNANIIENLTHQKTRVQEVNESFGSEVDKLKLELNELKSQFKECPGVTFHFPRDRQVEDYVRYTSYVPAMDEFTMCTWVETNVYDDSIFSYAISSQDNELWIFFQNANRIRLALEGQYVTLEHQQRFQKNVNVHICVWYSFAYGEVGLFLNGTEMNTTAFLPSRSVTGGGSLILGQEQDTVRGGFDSSQAFSGNLTNVIAWYRVLSQSEIFNIVNSCICPQDYVIAMLPSNTEIFGEAYYSNRNKCPVI